jgi:hypothetical protein
MPISNPLLTINSYGSSVLLEPSDPSTAPSSEKVFWLNTITNKLWIAVSTNSLSDWIAIGGSNTGEPVDVASILNKILVQDGQVLTTDDHVIFED